GIAVQNIGYLEAPLRFVGQVGDVLLGRRSQQPVALALVSSGGAIAASTGSEGIGVAAFGQPIEKLLLCIVDVGSDAAGFTGDVLAALMQCVQGGNGWRHLRRR